MRTSLIYSTALLALLLHQANAELSRAFGHPIRIRVLELLQDGTCWASSTSSPPACPTGPGGRVGQPCPVFPPAPPLPRARGW